MADPRYQAWRLYPSERILWQGAPVRGIPRDRRWVLVPALFLSFAAIAALFAGLLAVSGIPAVRPTSMLAFFLLLTGVSIRVLPQSLLDPCEFMITDRRVLWRRGRYVRSMDRFAITFGRIHWHRSRRGIGHLELVRAVPFGPLARRQRLVFHDVRAPDVLYALIRDVQPSEYAGYSDVPLTGRLDRDEHVLWGAAPDGWLLGWSDVLTGMLGLLALVAAAAYGYRTAGLLLSLETLGLPVQSWTWALFFSAIAISWTVMMSVGAALLWQGLWGARRASRATEYVITDRRLLIRRGRTELSVDRRQIVDVADVPSSAGSHNLHLILDAPQARALEASGALSLFGPARAQVPPVLFEVRDTDKVRALLTRLPETKLSTAA